MDIATFAEHLTTGRGAVYLAIQQQGLEPYAEILLDGCLYSSIYSEDFLQEFERAQWLYPLFVKTPYYSHFAQAIRDAFQPDQDESYDDPHSNQRFALLALMALDGDQDAYRLIQYWAERWLAEHDMRRYQWSEWWLALAGQKALLPIVRGWGYLVPHLDEFYVPTLERLLELCHESFTPEQRQISLEQAHADVQAAATFDFYIKAYWEYHSAEGQEELARQQSAQAVQALTTEQREKRRCARLRKELPLAELLSQARKRRMRNHFTMQLGTCLSLVEQQWVLHQIESEPDEEVAASLLWFFKRVALPNPLSPKVWQLIKSTNPKVVTAMLVVLAQNQHPQIGAYAREILSQGQLNKVYAELIGLFKLNYQQGDELLIRQVLEHFAEDKDAIHTLGFILNDWVKYQALPALAPLLYWMYEHNPCSMCRGQIVESLEALNALTPELLRECQYDVQGETRAWASKRLSINDV